MDKINQWLQNLPGCSVHVSICHLHDHSLAQGNDRADDMIQLVLGDYTHVLSTLLPDLVLPSIRE